MEIEVDVITNLTEAEIEQCLRAQKQQLFKRLETEFLVNGKFIDDDDFVRWLECILALAPNASSLAVFVDEALPQLQAYTSSGKREGVSQIEQVKRRSMLKRLFNGLGQQLFS